jgi:hypothetical protein
MEPSCPCLPLSIEQKDRDWYWRGDTDTTDTDETIGDRERGEVGVVVVNWIERRELS